MMLQMDERIDIRAERRRMHKLEAASIGITEEELHRRKARLKVLWEEGGGIDTARARLRWAEDYLNRHRDNSRQKS